jgi:hypothetical protein
MMAKIIIVRVLAFLVALGGLIFLWQSTLWGLDAVSGIINHIGSISGESEHLVVYAGPVIAFQLIGAVLLGIGLFRVLELPKPEGEKHGH